MKRLGFIARADNTGLGVKTWEYFKNLHPDKTMVIDISHLKEMKAYPERYEAGNDQKVMFVHEQPSKKEVDEFLNNIDVLFSCETFYNPYLLNKAKQLGIRTVLQPNFEFLNLAESPDFYIAPSEWNFQKARKLLMSEGWSERKTISRYKFLPVPINRELLPFELKKKAKTFLHIAGKPALKDRNGTNILLEAIPLVKSNVKFLIRSQEPIKGIRDKRVTVITKNIDNYWELYDNADVMVMPRKFGGLCLPLNEAMSKGLVPIMPDISPQNKFLHKDCLVEAELKEVIPTKQQIELYEITPQDLAKKIDWMANQDITHLSHYSNRYADKLDWERMRVIYNEELR